MSVRTMACVWANSKHGGTELLMLLALADFADDAGNAYPAVGTLADKCRVSSRQANNLLAELRASGELEVRHNEGPKGTNRYRITLMKPGGVKRISPHRDPKPLKPASSPTPETGFTPEAGFTLKSVARTPEIRSSKPLKPASDEPSVNHQEPNTTRKRPKPPALDVVDVLPEVDAQTLRDWQQVRKAKKVGPVTSTVAKSIQAEAKKAGLTIQQAIEHCCKRGWAGFEAEWLKPNGRPVLDCEDVWAGAK